MRELAWEAIRQSAFIIQFGTPGERLGIIKTILSRTASMVGSETTTRFEQMRNEFEDMMVGIRGTDLPLEEIFEEAELQSDD